MCPSRLPNEETSYRPSGMLDRDQRTAFTINRIRGGPSTIPTITAVFTTSDLNHKNNRSNSNHQCKNTSVKCDPMLIGKKEQQQQLQQQMKDISGGYNCTRKCDCQLNNCGGTLWEDRSVTSIRLARKYTTTSGYYRSRTKSLSYLLVFICIWLATIHYTCAYPTMSGENFGDPDAQRCKAIRDALNKPIEQANMSSAYIRGLVENYTQAQFKKTPIAVHQEWRKHQAHFDYSRDIEKYLPEDFDGETPQHYFEHLLGEGPPTVQELTEELERIYVCLQTLRKVFAGILNDRRTNETQIMHHLNNNRKSHDAINNLFEQQFLYNDLDIDQLETVMKTLKIPFPELEEVQIGKKDRIIGEWLATREYLKVLRYMRGVYNILLERCS